MGHFRDPEYLRKEQYKDGTKLSLRANLHERYSIAPVKWMDWVFEFIIKGGALDILEVGSGIGNLWNQPSNDLPKNSKLLLSDFSWGIIKDAKATILNKPIQFASFDVQQLPLSGQSKDLIIANHMLYHLPDLNSSLSEISRVLRKDGTFICTSNGLNHMTEIATWVQEALDPKKVKKDYLADWEVAIEGFSVNNGESILNKFFLQVKYFPFEDKLVIDDPMAIVDYLASSSLYQINEKKQEIIFHHLEKLLERNNKLEVRKESGLFLATNAAL